ncbi:hypothetical protein HanRHA438_Chr03g0105561 [Helianthus annuus]|nr:hypothetical protein HanRHA438_Chr03g0105561 [Helianthus annuus]
MVISFSLLLHTRDYFTYRHTKRFIHTDLYMNSLNFFVDFSNYMYFRELIGSGKCCMLVKLRTK